MAAIDRNYAAGAGYCAAHVLKLHRRMVNVEAVAQHMFDPVENMIALRGRHIVNEYVAAQRVRIRAQTPDVQIMHVEHTIDRPNRGNYLLQFQTFG